MTRIPYRREPPEPLGVQHSSLVLQLFAATNRYCWWCGLSEADCPLEIDHICGAAGRSDEVKNLLRLCRSCHQRLHEELPKETAMRIRLYLKQSRDPINFDTKRLAVLYGRPLPQAIGAY